MQYYVIKFQNTALGPNPNVEYGDICAATEYFPQKFVGSFQGYQNALTIINEGLIMNPCEFASLQGLMCIKAIMSLQYETILHTWTKRLT